MEDKSGLVAIVGLGNPGPRYARTRHNAGEMFVQHLARAHSFGSWKTENGVRVARGTLGGSEVLAVLPLVPMNVSGRGVAKICLAAGCMPTNIIVCHDDLDLVHGRLKVKQGGSNGGHKGLDSCQASLRSADYWRFRIGIGRPSHKEDVPDFVLEPFSQLELRTLSALFEHLAGPTLGASLPTLCCGTDPAVRSRLINAMIAAPQPPPAKQGGESKAAQRATSTDGKKARARTAAAVAAASASDAEACEPQPKRQQSWGATSLSKALDASPDEPSAEGEAAQAESAREASAEGGQTGDSIR